MRVRVAGRLKPAGKAEFGNDGFLWWHYRLKLPGGGSFSVRLKDRKEEGWYYLDGVVKGGERWVVFYPEVVVPTTEEFASSFCPTAFFEGVVLKSFSPRRGFQRLVVEDEGGAVVAVLNLSAAVFEERERISGSGRLKKRGVKVEVDAKDLNRREDELWIEAE